MRKILSLLLCAGSLSHAVVTTMDVVSEGEAIIYSSPPFHLHYNRDIGVTDILSIHPNTLNILDEIDGQYLVWLSVVTGEAYNYLPIAIQSLYDSASPATAVDETTNGYDALYVDNVGAAFDGVADKLVIAGLAGTESVTNYGGTATPTVGVGEITFTAGTCWNLQLDNGSTYPLVENSGAIAYDVTSTNDASITVGAGGEAAFWAPRQDKYAYMPLNGGTVALDIDTSLQVVSTASTGTKSLTQKFLFKADDDATLFTSNSKSLTATHLETDPAGLMTIYYDGTPVGSGYVGDRITITTDVDIGASLSIGATGVGDWEWLSTTVADNGGWKAELYDVSNDLVKNTDSTKGDALVAGGSGVYQKQYPALSDGSDDVAGLGLLNPPARHNGGIYNIQQAFDQRLEFNGTTSYGVVENSESQDPRTADMIIEGEFRRDSLTGNEYISSKNSEDDKGWGLYTAPTSPSGFTTFFYTYDQATGSFRQAGQKSGYAWQAGTDVKFYIEKTGEDVFLDFNGETATRVGGAYADIRENNVPIALGASFNSYATDPTDIFEPLDGAIKWLRITIGGTVVYSIGADRAESATPSVVDSAVGGDLICTDVTVENYSPASSDFIVNTFWSADGITFDAKTYLDFKTHLDGSNYVWNIWANTTGVCVADKIITTTNELTAAQWEGMDSLRTPACSAGALEALKDIDGEYVLSAEGFVILVTP